jgi:acyl-CoA thioesterase
MNPQFCLDPGLGVFRLFARGSTLMVELKKIIKGTSPFAEMLGIRVVGVGDGVGECALEIREEMLNLHGSVHGGVIYSLADIGMGVALHSLLGQGERCSTIEIKMNYFMPARGKGLVCTSRVLQRGKSIAVLEAEIKDRGRLIAKGMGTFAVLAAGGNSGKEKTNQ